MFAMTYFNYDVCGGAGFLIDSYWAEFADAELDIQYSWADAVEKVQDYFIDPIPNMGYDEKAISYLVEFDPSDAPDDVLQEAYVYIDESLWSRTNTATFTINFSTEDDTTAAVENIATVLEGAGWDSKLDEDGAKGYTLTENEKVVSQALYEYSDTQITIYYMAHDETVGYDSAAEILTIYQNAVNDVASELELENSLTSLIDLSTTAEAASAGYLVDVSEISAASMSEYGFFADATLSITFASADDAAASAAEIQANLLEAGFVDGIYNDWLQFTGMYNLTSNEFVALNVKSDTVILTVEYVDMPEVSFSDFFYLATAATAYSTYAGYASYFMNAYATYGMYTGGIALPAFAFGDENDPVYTDIDFSDIFWLPNAYGASYFMMEFDFAFYFEGEDAVLAAYQNYAAALVGAGFVEAENALFEVTGFYNATTGEFVMMDGDLETGRLGVYVLIHNLTLAGSVITPVEAGE